MRLHQKFKHQFVLLYDSSYNRKHPIYALIRFMRWNVFKLLNYNFHATLWGYKFKFWINSHQSYWLYKNYYLDSVEFSIIDQIVRPNDIIFDIGANVGIYSFWFSKCINNNGRIYSFEPDETNMERFKYLIGLNNINSIYPQQIALSNSIAKAKFSIGLDEQNGLLNDSQSSTEQYNIVNTNTIDSFCAENSVDVINYLKIDVEGAEWFVLSGATLMLTQHKIKIIQLEINKQLAKYSISVKQLVDFMAAFGYKLYRLNSKLKEIDISLENLLDEDSNNYFFIADLNYINVERVKK
jgi:FkbM family methyltransferase